MIRILLSLVRSFSFPCCVTLSIPLFSLFLPSFVLSRSRSLTDDFQDSSRCFARFCLFLSLLLMMASPSDSSLQFFQRATPIQWSYVLSNYKEVLKLKAHATRGNKKNGPEELIKLDTWYVLFLIPLFSCLSLSLLTFNFTHFPPQSKLYSNYSIRSLPALRPFLAS